MPAVGRRAWGRASSPAEPCVLPRSRTSMGSRMVKVEPLSHGTCGGDIAPIIWQKRRPMASPNPVPPYCRVVEASTWTKS